MIRAFMAVVVFAPLVLAPTLVFKAPLWSHTSGMLGVLLSLFACVAVSALLYFSDSFGNNLLLYRGAVNRRSLASVLCGLETNALMWVLAIIAGYAFGLNAGVLLAAQNFSFRLRLAFSIYAGVAMTMQTLITIGFCYAPLLRFIGLRDAKMFSPVESLSCVLTAIIMGELLGFAFALYSMIVIALAAVSKDTALVYVLGLYGAIVLVCGVVVSVRALYIFFCRPPSRAHLSADIELL